MSQLSDHLNCPVCICQLTNTAITPCGHRYCYGCIKECINRHHKCPVCNNKLQVQHLIRDKTFDELICKINEESSESEKTYFESLTNPGGTKDNEGEFTPVEKVLKKHLKQSLVDHQQYYQELKKDFQRRLHQLDQEHQRKKDQISEMGASAADIERELESLQKDTERQKESVQEEMTRCTNLVAEAYNKYLTDHVPNLAVLPVTVTINVLNKNILLEKVEIKPHDSLSDIRTLLFEKMEAKGDKVVKLGDDVKFLIFGPFTICRQYEMIAMASGMIEHSASHHDVTILKENIRPVMELGMKTGSHIVVYGQLQCESDLPKKCFASTFTSDMVEKVDYFTCQDCRFNWICRSCMDVCHKDHRVVPYIMGHQPTWACCYCPKKKKCTM